MPKKRKPFRPKPKGVFIGPEIEGILREFAFTFAFSLDSVPGIF
jgi:hypothetical protein